MRTKTTLAAAALLAAGLASSMAQNVYSLNVVGYVNVVVAGSGANNLLSNPLSNQAGNNNNTLFAPALLANADGSTITKWNTLANNFDLGVATWSSELAAWDSVVPLAVGEGFFFVNYGPDFTVTFVGEIPASVTRTIVGDGGNNCIGSTIPLGGSFQNVLGGFNPADGDTVNVWNVPLNNFDTITATYSTELVAWDTALPNVAPGIGMFLVHYGAGNQSWTRNFVMPP